LIQKLNELVIRDSLTGLYNKTYVQQELSGRLQQVTKKNEKLSVAILDVDSFKEINDTFGHLIGDYVLTTIAEYIAAQAEDSDIWAARIGGDEFLIVFENMDYAQSEKICNLILEQLSSHEFYHKEVRFSVQLSYGLKEYLPGESFTQMFESIDHCMYEMKRQHHNRK